MFETKDTQHRHRHIKTIKTIHKINQQAKVHSGYAPNHVSLLM